MVLHETRIFDTVVGGDDADAAVGLLHDDGEDEASVDAGGGRDALDAALDVGDLVG